MKKIGFFTLALVFLASGLIFLGCDSELPGNGNGNGGGGTPVAAVLTFWGEDSQNRDVRIRITTPPERLPGPSTGDAFNITVFNQGDAEDETFTGTITVSGTDPIAITFNQTAPTAGSTFSGSFARETGTMTTTGTIPGTTISGITAQLGGIEPPGGGGGGGGGGTGGGGGGVPVNQGTLFIAERHATAVSFYNPSNKAHNRLAPTHSLNRIFEGFRVEINNPRIIVTYNDGTSRVFNTTALLNANFIIDPPIWAAQANVTGQGANIQEIHVIYTGTAGAPTSPSATRFVRSSNYLTIAANSPTTANPGGASFYSLWYDGGGVVPLLPPQFAGSAFHEYNPNRNLAAPILPHVATLNIREDDTFFGPIVGRHLRVFMWDGGTDARLTITDDHPMRVVARDNAIDPNDGFDYRIEVEIGNQNIRIPLQGYDVFRISGITSAAPARRFILYDDPRFDSADANETNIHWLNLLRDGSVTVTYRNAANDPLQRATTIPALYRQAMAARANPFGPVAPSIVTTATHPELRFIRPLPNLTNPMVSLRYTGTNPINSVAQSLNVPMYNNLVRITVEPIIGGLIMMNGAASPSDGPNQFLNRVRIGAVYQLGNDRNNTVRRENVLRDMQHPALFPAPSGKRSMYQNTVIDPGVSSVLTRENSERFARNGGLSRVFVSLSPQSGGMSIGTVQARIDIGVINY